MADNDSQTPTPNLDLKALEKLIGTWEWTGSLKGKSMYEWAEGGFFLIHHFDFEHDGQQLKGIEYLGHEKSMGAEPSTEIKTRIYGYLDGLTQDYVYEVTGDNTYTVWAGEKNSPMYMHGTFSDNATTNEIEWTYPGGGYSAVAKKTT